MSDEQRAFKLAEISLDELQGASVAYGPDAYLFDIKSALDAGDGVITTSDPTLIGTLTSLRELLVQCPVEDGAEEVELPVQPEVQAPQPVSYTPQEPVPAVHDEAVADVVEEEPVIVPDTPPAPVETGDDPDPDAKKTWR